MSMRNANIFWCFICLSVCRWSFKHADMGKNCRRSLSVAGLYGAIRKLSTYMGTFSSLGLSKYGSSPWNSGKGKHTRTMTIPVIWRKKRHTVVKFTSILYNYITESLMNVNSKLDFRERMKFHSGAEGLIPLGLPFVLVCFFSLRLIKIPRTMVLMINTTSATGIRMMIGVKSCVCESEVGSGSTVPAVSTEHSSLHETAKQNVFGVIQAVFQIYQMAQFPSRYQMFFLIGKKRGGRKKKGGFCEFWI